MTPQQVSAITGHATMNLSRNLGATENYIHNLIETNLHLYERVESSILGHIAGEWFAEPSEEDRKKWEQENPKDDFEIVEDGYTKLSDS